MVGDEEEVGLLKGACLLGRLDDLEEPTLGVLNAGGYLLGEKTRAVTVAVNVAGVEKEEVGLVLFDHIAGYTNEKLIGVGMSSDLYLFDMGSDALAIKLGSCSRAEKSFLLGILGRLRPVLGEVIVDVFVTCGNGPENASGGKSRLFSCSENVGALDIVCKPSPGNVLGHAGHKDVIVGNTVLVGIATRGHRSVAGICNRGVDGAGALYHRALREKLCKSGAGVEEILDILINHCVAGENDYSAL